MQYIWFLDAVDCDMAYQAACVEGTIDTGPNSGRVVVEYLTDDFYESGVVDFIWPNEKGDVAFFDSIWELKRFANKMRLLREIKQAQTHREE